MKDKAIDEILGSFESKMVSDILDARNGRPGARTFGVDDKPRETALAQLLAEIQKQVTLGKIEALRSIDCIVYDPVDLEKYLDELIAALQAELEAKT